MPETPEAGHATGDGPYGPLIPMPELTPDALRTAVARIAPSRIPTLTQHLFEATTNAQQTQSLAPLWAFVHSWTVFVAIERHPQRAARLRELERIVDAGEEEPAEAIAEIHRIRAAAEAAIGRSGGAAPAWGPSGQSGPSDQSPIRGRRETSLLPFPATSTSS